MTNETTTTAMVRVNPQIDTEVMAFYNEATKLQEYAQARVITTAEDLKPATDDLSIIARVKRALEEKRREYVKPLQDHVKIVNDAFKSLMQPIETADQITRTKILAFQATQELKRREQEEINRLRLEAAQKEMELKGEITESVQLVEVSPEAPKKVQTEMGTTTTFKVRKWEIIDFSLVPDDLKVIDAGKVTKLVKAGIGSITGIRIWEEDSLRVNTK